MEVVEGIHRIEAPLGDRIVCLYLLIGDRGVLLVDTGLDGTPRESLLPYLDANHVEPAGITYVLTTHIDFDHAGGNGTLHESAPHALFLCHELDRAPVESVDCMIEERYGQFRLQHDIDESAESKEWIRANARHVPVNVALRGGERIRLGQDWWVDVLHTPGHSRGHVAIYDSRSRAAVIGDAALGSAVPTAGGVAALPPTYRYVETYTATLQRLESMDIEVLLTSHFPVYGREEASAFLGDSRSFVDRVDTALTQHLRSERGAVLTKDLISALNASLGQWPDDMSTYLAFPFLGHLEKMARYGLIKTVPHDERDGLLAWEWCK